MRLKETGNYPALTRRIHSLDRMLYTTFTSFYLTTLGFLSQNRHIIMCAFLHFHILEKTIRTRQVKFWQFSLLLLCVSTPVLHYIQSARDSCITSPGGTAHQSMRKILTDASRVFTARAGKSKLMHFLTSTTTAIMGSNQPTAINTTPL